MRPKKAPAAAAYRVPTGQSPRPQGQDSHVEQHGSGTGNPGEEAPRACEMWGHLSLSITFAELSGRVLSLIFNKGGPPGTKAQSPTSPNKSSQGHLACKTQRQS